MKIEDSKHGKQNPYLLVITYINYRAFVNLNYNRALRSISQRIKWVGKVRGRKYSSIEQFLLEGLTR